MASGRPGTAAEAHDLFPLIDVEGVVGAAICVSALAVGAELIATNENETRFPPLSIADFDSAQFAAPRRGEPYLDEPEAKPFWAACREHKLTAQRCSSCKRIFGFPPQALCPYPI